MLNNHPGVNTSKSPILPPNPLDHPGVVKIALGQSASDALTALGPHCLVIASKTDSTAPEAARGRMVLLCLPLTKDAADDAFRAATGRMRAVKVKPV